MTRTIDVAVVDEDAGLFEGMSAYAAASPDLRVRRTSMAALLSGADARPDVVLVELAAPPVADVRALCQASYRVLALSRSADPYLIASLLGTGACLLLGGKQTITAIAAAIRASGPGSANGNCLGPADERPRLSQRERSVLLAYASGLTLDAVAEQVGIRPSTAKTYLERVKAKFHEIGRPAYTKGELAQRALEYASPAEGL